MTGWTSATNDFEVTALQSGELPPELYRYCLAAGKGQDDSSDPKQNRTDKRVIFIVDEPGQNIGKTAPRFFAAAFYLVYFWLTRRSSQYGF